LYGCTFCDFRSNDDEEWHVGELAGTTTATCARFRRSAIGSQAGDDLAAVAAVKTEIRVGGEEERIGEGFRHANEAGVGEAHGNVGVFLDEPTDRLDIFRKMERDDKGTAAKHGANAGVAAITQQVIRLGQYRLASGPGRR